MANLFQLLLAQIHPRQGRPAGEPERAEGYKTHPKRESNNKVRETRVLETGESTQERERASIFRFMEAELLLVKGGRMMERRSMPFSMVSSV